MHSAHAHGVCDSLSSDSLNAVLKGICIKSGAAGLLLVSHCILEMRCICTHAVCMCGIRLQHSPLCSAPLMAASQELHSIDEVLKERSIVDELRSKLQQEQEVSRAKDQQLQAHIEQTANDMQVSGIDSAACPPTSACWHSIQQMMCVTLTWGYTTRRMLAAGDSCIASWHWPPAAPGWKLLHLLCVTGASGAATEDAGGHELEGRETAAAEHEALGDQRHV